MAVRERGLDQIRAISIEEGFSQSAASVIFRMGQTVVHCSAMSEERVPPFVQDGKGWVTAEYAMLPASSGQRIQRARNGRVDGRSQEIQRLIGRSLRAVVDMGALGPRTIYLDCDVLSADGGTRCASICGAYIAFVLATRKLQDKGLVDAEKIMLDEVAAISVGIVDGQAMVDLAYEQDVRAEVDMNLVMTGKGNLIEVQGTGERSTFSIEQLQELIKLGQGGIEQILEATRTYLKRG
ncbi:MAG: ribonuclease PH [Myxococcales bacterium]|nr:ribonuclease PH [Myxococcales bacterium]MCB9641935.1 ribonuclease PH [Myxococcales bacterium]